MARKRGKSKARTASVDLGPAETRGRCTPAPLLSTDVEVHRVSAGIGIRMAIEEGLDPAGMDLIQIGMGGGSTGYNPFGWTPQERLMEARYALGRWRDECRLKGLRADLAEMWSCGMSVRQVAAAHGMNRPKAGKAIDEALDAYAEMRGYRRRVTRMPGIAVWETPDAVEFRAEAGFAKAEIKKRNVRGRHEQLLSKRDFQGQRTRQLRTGGRCGTACHA